MKRFYNVVAHASLSILFVAALSVSVSAQQQFDLNSLSAPGGPPGFDLSLDNSADDTPLTVQAEFTAPEGETPAYLFVTVNLEPNWHIYSMTQTGSGPIPTKIKVDPSATIESIGKFSVSPPPKKHMDPGFKIMVENHYGTVTWFAPVKLSPGVDLKSLEIRGSVFAQPCKDACLPPEDHQFVAKLSTNPEKYAKILATAGDTTRGPPEDGTVGPAAATEGATGAEAADETSYLDAIEAASSELKEEGSLGWSIFWGFLGGLILNIMPCVLPVIGLKILSFIEQAGHDRRHAFMLNLWYSFGLISVFVLLAILTVTLGLGWGGLFRYAGMNIAMAAVVFVMALSFLGLWEIPIPGFVGSGKAEAVSQKEGAIGAFSKGVLTTILATPCSGPFLASAIAWAVTRPPIDVFAIFISIGLGMASPYLLIGAFPKLIRFLPKPGAWMETFKQVMGFVLLATVIFLLHSTSQEYVLPLVTFLFGLWGACWWIGRTSVLAPTRIKLLHWGEAIAFSVLVWFVAFTALGPQEASVQEAKAAAEMAAKQLPAEGEYAIAWQPFTNARLEQLMKEKKSVLIDFTADWCATCKTLETFVLDTEAVENAIKANDVVTLRADWTHRGESKEVDNMLKVLGSKQVPVIVVIPNGNPKKMSIFRGGYTKSDIIGAIEK